MAVAAGPNLIEDGLIFCIDAANPKSYPGSGNIWYDIGSSNSHGTLNNGAILTSNPIQTMTFGGGAQHANFDSFLPTLNQLTYSTECYWMRVTHTIVSGPLIWFGSYYNPIGNFTSGNSLESISIHQSNIRAYYTNGHNFYTNSDWLNICYVYGSGFNKIYVNGVDLPLTYETGSSTTTKDPYNASKFIVAKRTSDNWGGSFDVSSIYFYDRALSANEIQYNYNLYRTNFGI